MPKPELAGRLSFRKTPAQRIGPLQDALASRIVNDKRLSPNEMKQLVSAYCDLEHAIEARRNRDREAEARARAKEKLKKLSSNPPASKVDPIEPEADLSILGEAVQEGLPAGLPSPGPGQSGEAVQSQVAIRTPPAAHV